MSRLSEIERIAALQNVRLNKGEAAYLIRRVKAADEARKILSAILCSSSCVVADFMPSIREARALLEER